VMALQACLHLLIISSESTCAVSEYCARWHWSQASTEQGLSAWLVAVFEDHLLNG
jgi:hypothetical protein